MLNVSVRACDCVESRIPVWQAGVIYYVLIIDACRETLEHTESAVGFSGTLEPRNLGAMKWALCTGTNRGSLAKDAGSDAPDLGAFTGCMLSKECGLFEPNVPFKTAVKLVRDRVREKSKSQQAPLMLLDNIEDDFCLHDAPMETERFDVCISYRKDTDGSKAGYIAERLRPHVDRLFLEPVPGKPAPPHRQIAGAVCNSKVIILILSENSFADISTLTSPSQASKRHEELANLLRQMDMILEVHEHHRVKPVRVLAVFYGDEHRSEVTFDDTIKEVDVSKCWPIVLPQNARHWESLVRQKALKDLRCVDRILARSLHDRFLSQIDDIPSLIKGRQVDQTLRAIRAGFEPMKLYGKKQDEVEKVVKDVLALLQEPDLRSSAGSAADTQSGPHQGYKRPFESDESEAGAGAKRANTDSRDGSKAAGKRAHDAGEGSSSHAKKPRQDPVSASMSRGSRVGGEGDLRDEGGGRPRADRGGDAPRRDRRSSHVAYRLPRVSLDLLLAL